MRRLLYIAAILSWAWPPLALAEDQGLLNRCWAPDALAGTDRERLSTRSHGKLDLAPLRQQPLPAATPVPPELRGSIRGVALPPEEKLIALTFDLCETDGDVAGYDGRIVDLLRAQGVKATFFAGGKWLETHKERAWQLMADPNFEIGSHGLRHYDLSNTSDANLSDEIVLTEAAYAQTRASLLAKQCAVGFAQASEVPERMSVMRFPYGRCSAKSLAAVADAGLVAIQWDIVTGDPDPHRSAKAIANTILAQAHPGAIIVAHANGRGWHTADALALAIPKLKEQGYSFVTVSELLAAGKPVIAATCYLNRPGDTPRHVAKLQPKGAPHDLFSIIGPDQ
ncbi:polysaccharide deacetylase family protein [Methyloceanibacter sp.]|uniref:polysaccharide deacetylase family protein n=1 Tax=Methyloceanibacter sp. TaxID=1965321 RepID=UPI002D751CA8|nr:polysaccharide deacetylase family protein [Methyloceanibacter sp.]HZP08841.1 polysaccharide deacetylase family protein [Methyloceanibacter sp.]